MTRMSDCPGAADKAVELYKGGVTSFRAISTHPEILAKTKNEGMSVSQVQTALTNASVPSPVDVPPQAGPGIATF